MDRLSSLLFSLNRAFSSDSISAESECDRKFEKSVRKSMTLAHEVHEDVPPPDTPTFTFSQVQATVFTVPPDHMARLRALVISDQLFGKTLVVTKSLPKCFANIMTLITRENLNCIFVLGDLIYPPDDDPKLLLTKVISEFERFPIPVYINGGARTRPLLHQIEYSKPGTNVKIVKDYLIKLRHPKPPLGTPQHLFLASALLPPNALKTDRVGEFVLQFKRAFAADIANEDYLLLGGCGGYSLNEEQRCASIKAFSPDDHHNAHAIVVAEEGGFGVRVIGK
jgi:hypothetical protein